MYKIEKGTPFYIALLFLVYTYNYPKDIETYAISFWLKYWFLRLLAIFVVIVEPVLHIVMSLKNETGLDVIEDIAISIGHTGAVTISYLFTIKFKKWINFLSEVTFFEDVGDISITLKNHVKRFNMLYTIYCVYCITGAITWAIINFSQSTACKQLVQENNLQEICGTFISIWFPFIKTNLTSLTIIISVTQIILSASILCPAIMIMCLVWESTEILIIHINILKECFISLFEGPGGINNRLRFCIKYHIRILSMGSRLNILVKYTISQMTFVSAVAMGVILNQMMNTGYGVVTGGIFLAGYAMGAFIMCHSGERIKSKTLSLADAVCASNWHKADAKTRRDLAFVLSRCQKPVHFDSLPLGILDYPLFIMILKTSYSYLTLLNETM